MTKSGITISATTKYVSSFRTISLKINTRPIVHKKLFAFEVAKNIQNNQYGEVK